MTEPKLSYVVNLRTKISNVDVISGYEEFDTRDVVRQSLNGLRHKFYV